MAGYAFSNFEVMDRLMLSAQYRMNANAVTIHKIKKGAKRSLASLFMQLSRFVRRTVYLINHKPMMPPSFLVIMMVAERGLPDAPPAP